MSLRLFFFGISVEGVGRVNEPFDFFFSSLVEERPSGIGIPKHAWCWVGSVAVYDFSFLFFLFFCFGVWFLLFLFCRLRG